LLDERVAEAVCGLFLTAELGRCAREGVLADVGRCGNTLSTDIELCQRAEDLMLGVRISTGVGSLVRGVIEKNIGEFPVSLDLLTESRMQSTADSVASTSGGFMES